MATFTIQILDAVESVLAHVHNTLQPASATETPASNVLIVGVSGGADSVCLLHALAQVAGRWGLALHVAHLDHSLRPDSPDDAAHVARLAAALGLPLHMQRLPPGSLARAPGGMENGARRARYAFLSALAARLTPEPQQPTVCVAHHANDQAETVLMNLTRGSGLRGLGGMQPVAPCPENHTGRAVQLLRPLLSVERGAIEAYLRAHDLSWCEDSSNTDEALVRNRLRHAVLPLLQTINPGVVQTLARTASLLADEAQRLAAHDRALLASLRLDGATGGLSTERVVLDWAALWRLDAASLRSVLRIAVLHVAGGAYDLPFSTADEFVGQLRAEGEHPSASGPHPLWGGVAWSIAGAVDTQPVSAPARLSIHRQDALPFPPDHPYLHQDWCSRTGTQGVPVSADAPSAVGGGWALHVDEIDVQQLPADWKERADPWMAYLDAARATELHLTVPRPGMRFAPLGLGGRHKSLGDLFTDRKIPVSLREGWPLVVSGGAGREAGPAPRVLWVCGVQVAHNARITEHTRRVVRLCWRNERSMV